MPDAAQRRQQHQDLIARVRGDGGFLDGFSQGQPLATSRQRPLPGPVPVLADPPIVEQIFAPTINRTTVRNRFEAPVAITTGDNNLVLQQGSQSGGTNAQQQVVNIGGNARPGGASNVVTPSGTVLQQAGGDSAPRRRHLSRR
jgi:hypothetical protein